MKNSYPQIMMVWNDDNQHKQSRIVIGEVNGKFIAVDDDAPANARACFDDLVNYRSSFEVCIFDNAQALTNLERFLLDRDISIADIDVIRQLALNEE